MKLLFSEYPADYGKYNFPFQVYGLLEKDDKIETLYEMGFLPTRINKELFYLCRSLRVALEEFDLNSENRRILRKTEYLSSELIPLSGFEYSYEIGKMAKDFSKERFDDHVLSPQATKALFKDSSMTHVLVFTDNETSEVVGYCLCLVSGSTFHYSYPFYDTKYFDRNIGMGMILQGIDIALKRKTKYFYIGTCYTQTSLYKLQFENMEYYTGFGWSENIGQLKQLVKTPQEDHLFKLIEDKDSFIKLFKDGE